MYLVSLSHCALLCILLNAAVSHAVASSTYTGTSISVDPAVLSAARSCNAAKQRWVSNYGNLSFPSKTYVTATEIPTVSYSTSWTISTFPANPTSYTLCDGYPRINGSTIVTSSIFSTQQAIISSFTTAAPNYGNYSPPNCSVGSSACSILWSSYWQTYYGANLSSATPPAPICGTFTQETGPSMVAGDPVCYADVNVKLLY